MKTAIEGLEDRKTDPPSRLRCDEGAVTGGVLLVKSIGRDWRPEVRDRRDLLKY